MSALTIAIRAINAKILDSKSFLIVGPPISRVWSYSDSEAYLKFSLKGIILSLRAKVIVTSHGSEDVLFAPPTFLKIKEIYCHHGIPLRGARFNESVLKNRSLYVKQAVNSTFMLATSKWGAD